jgi:hypothetical protein
MSGTEDLLRQLSTDLKPVRRIAPLRVSAGIVLALWMLAVDFEWRLGGARPSFGEVGRWNDPVYCLLFGGLVAAAGAALVATLAQRVPGRESLARGAAGVVGAGAALAVGAAGAQWLASGPGEMAGAAAAWGCVVRSATLGVLPAIVAALLLRRSWRRTASGWVVPLFAAPLGAIAVHASCVAGGAEHMLLGHALGPLLVGTALAAAGWMVLRLRPATH